MKVDTKMLFGMSGAIHNFYNVTRVVDELGAAVLLKNGKPAYVVIDFSRVQNAAAIDDDVLSLAHNLVEQNRLVYEEMSK
ncbi:type II toxin-antitoxin system Phd/YefM family antitoxin [Flavonifractor sp. An306]|uniref:type II toxin-antitoxin system Phd/YefM family antitoxin n=1 Tax=Flavonifractor sp. An306 TaxID=1965629 RepID=UPI001749C1C7|nr:type II toxin-antitoxin system Phd/YefM family antitoxin [Flavonifractor sp. An306]